MKDMLLLDLETQSYPVESGIYEVACLALRDYEIVDQLYLGKEIEGYRGDKRWGYGFHDISGDPESIARFREFVAQHPFPIVAHNCGFDKKFLLHYGWVESDYPFYCAMRAVRRAVPSLESYALPKLVSLYDIAATVEHRALSDVLNLYELLRLIRPQVWLKVGERDHRNRRFSNRPKSKPKIHLPLPTTTVLAGETVCFTGKSEYPRHIMQEIAIKNGAEISQNVTATTTLLVVGTKAGSKLDKALARGIAIVSDEEFMAMLNLGGSKESASALEP